MFLLTCKCHNKIDNIFKFLNDHKKFKFTKKQLEDIIIESCKNGNYEIFMNASNLLLKKRSFYEKLCKKSKKISFIKDNAFKIFKDLCTRKVEQIDLRIIDQLISINPPKNIFREMQLYHECYLHNNVKMRNYLYENIFGKKLFYFDPQKLDINFRNEFNRLIKDEIKILFECDDIEMIEWLYNHGFNADFNVKSEFEKSIDKKIIRLFIEASFPEHPLYSIFGSEYDISIFNDKLFKKLCFNNDIIFVNLLIKYLTYLHSKGILLNVNYDIFIQNDKIIKYRINDIEVDIDNEFFELELLEIKLTNEKLNRKCLICDDSIGNIILPCGHNYCKNCFIQWFITMNNEKNCCYCTQSFDVSNCKYFK